jgi:hypothetical protein
MGARARGLECKLGHGRIVLPAEEIDLLGEYLVGARLPSSSGRVECAIGVWAGEPVLSLSLSPHPPVPSRTANGALLLVGSRGIRWALEIDHAVGLVEISTIAKGTAQAPWRRAATLSDQRSAQFIDIRLMVSTLEGGGA